MKLHNDGNELQIGWPDGLLHAFHPIWLRELSFEESAKDPATGHRLYEAAYLPLDLTIRRAELVDEGRVALEFSDGHRCSFDLRDLRGAVEHALPDDLVGDRIPWQRNSWQAEWRDYRDIAGSPAGLLGFFDDLAKFGVALVRSLPVEADGLQGLTELIGPIRETNWGRIADVRSIKNAYDLSMTDRALEPHVDNPYRLPQPGYIFLHCLVNDADGGESVLIDGFNVAARLEQENSAAFREPVRDAGQLRLSRRQRDPGALRPPDRTPAGWPTVARHLPQSVRPSRRGRSQRPDRLLCGAPRLRRSHLVGGDAGELQAGAGRGLCRRQSSHSPRPPRLRREQRRPSPAPVLHGPRHLLQQAEGAVEV